MSAPYRIFQGRETRQVRGDSASKVSPLLWYYEPTDYDGDVVWSEAYESREAAEVAASAEAKAGREPRWEP